MFVFSSSLDELQQSVDGTLKRDGKPIKICDDEQLLGMLIPLTVEQAAERVERFGIEFPKHGLADVQKRWDGSPPEDLDYTCRHWDEDTRLCTIYEDRPKMCRDFPYGKECTHGCGYTNASDATVIDLYTASAH